MKETIQPMGVSTPSGSWSQGVKVGELLFIAGQAAEDDQGRVVAPNDSRAQASMAFENMRRVVEAAGGSVEDIVKITAFLTNVEDFPSYNQVRQDFFKKDFPASTTVIVKELAKPEYLLEIEGVAVIAPREVSSE